MLYSNTGVSGSVTRVGSYRQLYDWLIPNRNTDQHIGIVVRSTCVGCRKGLECGVTDVSSLVVTRRRGCFVRVFLVLCLCDAVGLFHRPYK